MVNTGSLRARKSGSRTGCTCHYCTSVGAFFYTERGSFADYFTVACKTDDGFTVILVERGEGVETTPIKTSYSPTAGTAYVMFDNAKVPVENTLGPEGGGLFVILR